jgi:hypothetical protein
MQGNIPTWLTDMGFEAGDDLADYDAFECDRCGLIGDIDDSIGAWDEAGHRVYLCEACAAHEGLLD